MPITDSQSDEFVVTAKLETSNSSTPGTLLEMGPRTVGILVDPAARCDSDLGDRVTVTLSGDEVGGQHSAVGDVLGIHSDEHGLRVTVRYADTTDYDSLLNTGVGRRFNRRTSFRVEPATERPITVTIKTKDGRDLTGIAMDLSATGMALVVNGDIDLTSGQTLELGFSVQWDPKPLLFSGNVCYCGMRDGRMRYGVDFDAHRTVDFENVQDRLVDYVMTRQREILRRANQVDASSETSAE